MALTRDQVLHIARLARIRLDDGEVDRLTDQLSGILSHFDTLQAVDTDSVDATVYPLPLSNVMRADEQRPSLQREDVLGNAPAHEDGYIRVRAVLE